MVLLWGQKHFGTFIFKSVEEKLNNSISNAQIDIIISSFVLLNLAHVIMMFPRFTKSSVVLLWGKNIFGNFIFKSVAEKLNNSIPECTDMHLWLN